MKLQNTTIAMQQPGTSKAAGNAPGNSHNVAHDNLHTKNACAKVSSRQTREEAKKNAPEHLQCTLCDDVHIRHKCDVYIAMGFVDK